MGIPETDLIEEMDLSSVECLNMVRPPSRRPDRSPSPPPALPLERDLPAACLLYTSDAADE